MAQFCSQMSSTTEICGGSRKTRRRAALRKYARRAPAVAALRMIAISFEAIHRSGTAFGDYVSGFVGHAGPYAVRTRDLLPCPPLDDATFKKVCNKFITDEPAEDDKHSLRELCQQALRIGTNPSASFVSRLYA